MSKRVSQVLEFVTEQTCTLLLCSLIPGVSPFKFLGQPFLGFWETHSFPFLEQTFSTGQTGWSLPTPLLDFTLLCWELVPSGSSQNRRFSVQREAWWGDQAHRTWNLLYSTDFLWNIDIWAKAEQRWGFFTRNFLFATSLKTEEVSPSLRREFLKIFLFPSFVKLKQKIAKMDFSPLHQRLFFYGKRVTFLPIMPFSAFKGILGTIVPFSVVV